MKKKSLSRSLGDRYVSLNQGNIPLNQIWYKTNNGKMMGVLDDENEAGMKFYHSMGLVSNVYKNGIGKLTFRSTLTEIGERAFDCQTELKSVLLPDSIQYIREGAFNMCQSLTKIALSPKVETIGDESFAFCNNLKSVCLSKFLKDIGEYSFWCCYKLATICIPSSVLRIGKSAFEDCPGLLSINFNGTKDAWDKIKKGKLWNEVDLESWVIYFKDEKFVNDKIHQ